MTEHDLQRGIEKVLEILSNGDYENLNVKFFVRNLGEGIVGEILINKFNTPIIKEEKHEK